MNNIDKYLLYKLKKSDIRAFDSLFKTNFSGLHRFATDILKSSVAAEEVVQDVFLKLWMKRTSIIIKSSLKAYLYRMVYNTSLNYLRDNQNAVHNQIAFDDIQSRVDLLNIQSEENIFENLLSAEIEQELKTTIDELPPGCKEVFILCRMDGMSYKEVATHLNLSVSTVKTQISRAIKKLIPIVQKHLPD